MDTPIAKEASSVAIKDWAVEAESPGEGATCLCADLSPDINSHDQLMCAWYTAMNSASEMTHLPPPWSPTPQEDVLTTSDTSGADLPPLSPTEYVAFDEISPSAPPSTSAQQATSVIQTDPDKILAARIEATRQKSIARKAKIRNTHLNLQNHPHIIATQTPENTLPPILASSPQSHFPQKPPHTYPQLARLALLSQPDTPMTTVEIRTWIAERFAYYRDTEVPWRSGVGACLRKGEGFVGVEGGRWRVV